MTEDMGSARLEFSRDRLLTRLILVCLAVQVGLVVLDFYGNYANLGGPGPLRRLSALSREDSLAGWVAVTLTTLAALTAWLLAVVERAKGVSDCTRWVVVAAFLTYLAADDGAGIHERVGTVFSSLADDSTATSTGAELARWFPSYGWQVVYIPIFGTMTLYTVWILWDGLRPGRASYWPLVTLVAWPLAVALDFFEGLDPDHPLNLHEWIASTFDFRDYAEARFNATPFDTVGHFQRVAEETIEMVGTTFLWAALLAYLTNRTPDIDIRARS